MKPTHPDNRNRVILQKYPNFSFDRSSKKLFRGNFGSNVEIKKDVSGRLKVKKNGMTFMFSESELMKMTDYAGSNFNKGKGKV